MGIRGLTGYITKNSHEFLEFHQLRDAYLIIDGLNIYCALYREADEQLGAMGPRYDLFAEAIRNFFEALLRCDIRPIVVLDSLEALNKSKCIQMFKDKLERFKPGEDCALPHLVRDVFLNVLTTLKVKFVQTIAEADETMAALAKALDCAVLSADGDFFLQGTKFIPMSTLILKPEAVGGVDSKKFAIYCKIYNVKNLCRKFISKDGKYLNESVLPLALPILGNKNGRNYLDDTIMSPFLMKLDQDYYTGTTNFYHKKIEKTFKWLSQYSSISEAIASILRCIKAPHRQKIFEDIKMFISEIGIGSPLAVQALDLPEDATTKILDENAKKVLKNQSEMKELRREMKLSIDGGDEEAKEDTHHFTEEELVEMFPEWMIDALLNGKQRSIPFELLMFSVAILKPLTEDASQPPTGFASLPILKTTYSIISSLRDDNESALTIYYTKGIQVMEKNLLIKPSSFNLKDIATYSASERKLVIDEALGIDRFNFLGELPNCWRLYVATLAFWIKQEVEPKKKKAHIFAVIFAMLFGQIDDKLDAVVRDMLTFEDKFGDRYKEIIVKPRSSTKMAEGLSLKETMMLITFDECIAAAPFFIMHSSITACEFYQLHGDWKTVIHTFTQFHSCLKSAIVLNSILQYPYAEIPLHRTYNGLLFYKLFKAFEGQDDVDSYLREQLEHSPALLQSFIVLKGIVLSLIGEKNWDQF